MEWRSLVLVLLAASLPASPAVQPGEAGEPTNEAWTVDLEATDRAALEAALEDLGGDFVRVDERLDVALVRAPDALDARLDGVEPTRTDGPSGFVPSDTYWWRQWGPQLLDMPQAWETERGDEDVLVGIVDSGFSPQHEDLDDVPVTYGYDYVDRDQTPIDESGHGTHVAGIVAAEQDNDQGIAGMAEVSLFVTRVFGGPNSFCVGSASGIVDAADAGAEVINYSGHCSLVGPMQDAVTYAAAQDALVVTANGNEGEDLEACTAYQDPNPNPALLSVGAIDEDGGVADYSCRSPYVDLAAPGTGIRSTVPGGYADLSGTSMATPHVTGAAALIESNLDDPSAQTVRDLLISTADDAGEPGVDDAYGHGIVDPDEALELTDPLAEVAP